MNERLLGTPVTEMKDASFSVCRSCERRTIWIGNQIVWPPTSRIPFATKAMPADVAALYSEARLVFDASPRAAAALLRLALDKLTTHLGGTGAALNERIGSLVARGLPPTIAKSLDAVRIVGNNAVHPAEIDLLDSPEVAEKMFRLVNLIVDYLIVKPGEVETIFSRLPEGARTQIAKRDSHSSKGTPAPE